MKFIEKLFSESSDISCMRFMSVVSLFTGCAIAFILVYKNASLSEAVPVISVFVGTAFGGKAAQKYVELTKKD